jgi:hypothetical protein
MKFLQKQYHSKFNGPKREYVGTKFLIYHSICCLATSIKYIFTKCLMQVFRDCIFVKPHTSHPYNDLPVTWIDQGVRKITCMLSISKMIEGCSDNNSNHFCIAIIICLKKKIIENNLISFVTRNLIG